MMDPIARHLLGISIAILGGALMIGVAQSWIDKAACVAIILAGASIVGQAIKSKCNNTSTILLVLLLTVGSVTPVSARPIDPAATPEPTIPNVLFIQPSDVELVYIDASEIEGIYVFRPDEFVVLTVSTRATCQRICAFVGNNFPIEATDPLRHQIAESAYQAARLEGRTKWIEVRFEGEGKPLIISPRFR
jgi:hypothetical protein